MVMPDTQIVNQSYTLTMAQVMRVNEMAARLGVKKSEVVRRAVDAMYVAQGQESAAPAESNDQPGVESK